MNGCLPLDLGPHELHSAADQEAKKKRRRVPRSFKPCRERVVVAALLGNVEENADQPSQVPAVQLLDDPFEPFLTYEMVSSARRWMK